AAERALAAAGHRPGDLRACPRLGHHLADVVDLALCDLARLRVENTDAPAAAARREAALRRIRLEGRRGRPLFLRIAVEPVGDLVVREEDRRRLPRSHVLLTLASRPPR